MRCILFALSLLMSPPLWPLELPVVMYQVVEGEDWVLLASRHGLSEQQLRDDYNAELSTAELVQGDWIRVPGPAVAPALFPPLVSLSAPQQPANEKMMLTLAGAMKAAAEDRLDMFVERETSSLTDETLLFGTRQLSALPWISPEAWGWDYQLPLFDKDLRFNSRMALPLSGRWKGEMGVDYRLERLTYQLGLNYRQPLLGAWHAQVAPVVDYQDEYEHRRAGVTLALAHPDWRMGISRYRRFSGWRHGPDGWERPASGLLWFGEGRMPFVSGLTMAVSRYQWQGHRLSLQGSGDNDRASAAHQWSLSYSPWQRFRIQTDLRSNNQRQYESRVKLGIELPLSLSGGWFWPRRPDLGLLNYQPLRHHSVMVLEQAAYEAW
ncbi:inverse autotransporter beta domain-containing protein [Zobellella aerophila]|uniref:Inverse autotransporter beta-domain domain-containing protein n=1 Tax=Zobellella aerophila TaxID=870480 RepID=A0ABP6WIH6_9GAMM